MLTQHRLFRHPLSEVYLARVTRASLNLTNSPSAPSLQLVTRENASLEHLPLPRARSPPGRVPLERQGQEQTCFGLRAGAAGVCAPHGGHWAGHRPACAAPSQRTQAHREGACTTVSPAARHKMQHLLQGVAKAEDTRVPHRALTLLCLPAADRRGTAMPGKSAFCGFMLSNIQ